MYYMYNHIDCIIITTHAYARSIVSDKSFSKKMQTARTVGSEMIASFEYSPILQIFHQESALRLC